MGEQLAYGEYNATDVGSAMLTFEALSETVEFARKWVPFCKKHNIEPRAPEFYFAQKIDYLKGKIQPSFVKEHRAMKNTESEEDILDEGDDDMEEDHEEEQEIQVHSEPVLKRDHGTHNNGSSVCKVLHLTAVEVVNELKEEKRQASMLSFWNSFYFFSLRMDF